MSIFDDMRNLQQEINDLGMGVPKPADLATQLREAQARVAALEAENAELRDALEHCYGFAYGHFHVAANFRKEWVVTAGDNAQYAGFRSLHADILEAIAAARALAKEGS